MLDKLSINKTSIYNWRLSKPVLRYVLGTCLILTVTTLMDYPLSYLTSILALSFMAPGTKPLSFKKGFGFILVLTILTGFSYYFSEIFIDYPLVFMPMLCLGVLWIYYSQKLPMIIKLFALMSVLLIPLLALEAKAVSAFVALSLVFNTLMAISLTQLMFVIFPWDKEDAFFEKSKGLSVKNNDLVQFRYAMNIMIVLLPLLLLFFIFKLSGGILVLIFAAILSFSPALSNIKTGMVMIIANIFGGLCAIVAYKLLVVVPIFSFMVLLTLIVGLIFASNLFSTKKTAAIFGTGFSTFLLILGSVTSSDDAAGEAVWARVIQISFAVIYVVIAFGLLNYYQKNKALKNT
ncbi:MAG: hypothetical protein BM563_09375 [Bacteroidetes bacterium MedPE-SWsnd-G1]|nr:MAG: hypothetical protein BM563_09375 [Bacteroidetes bacterium MedPE-SWsnd-G1]